MKRTARFATEVQNLSCKEGPFPKIVLVWRPSQAYGLRRMEPLTTNVLRLPAKGQKTRRNFGPVVARKRGESNFMRAFERAYFARHKIKGMAAGEFSLAGFGVADLVWIGWSPDPTAEDFTALTLEKLLKRRRLHAFEGKLKDWRRALQQAFRYRYFADKAIVVMPTENAGPAISNLEAFQHLCVGLWAFDVQTGIIREHFTPTRIRAFSEEARQKAIKALASKLNLRQLRK
ncbi:MAG: hypothetical protein NTW21_42455 [Verrucomicrobia bacterium]|nr:hypothetical protein [Verrucomicrobiota bacterium]